MSRFSKFLAPLAVAVATLGIATGCGGNNHSSQVAQTTTTATTQVVGLPASCDPTNFFMQCSLNGASQRQNSLSGVLGVNIFGVDTYGAGNAGIGASFDCSYLSGSPGGKDWTSGGLAAWHSRGKSTCVVWESSSTRALDGFSAGQSDAIRARSEAAGLGIPTYQPIRFAVDTDTSGASVRSYFQGVRSILGSRTGVYGSYYVVGYLENAELTTPRADWQTLAWSGGHWGRACLEQTFINTFLDGQSVDFDHAICSDWGQVPAPVRPKPRIICYGKHATPGNATCKSVYAKVRKYERAVATSNGAYKARACSKLISLRNSLQARWVYFDHKLTVAPHQRRVHRIGARAATGRALNGLRRAITGRQCVAFQTRAGFYTKTIQALKRQYS